MLERAFLFWPDESLLAVPAEFALRFAEDDRKTSTTQVAHKGVEEATPVVQPIECYVEKLIHRCVPTATSRRAMRRWHQLSLATLDHWRFLGRIHAELRSVVLINRVGRLGHE